LDAVEPGLLPVGGLIEPLGVCGLFRGSLRRNGLQGAKQLNSPGIQVGPLSGPEQRPLEVNHGASVADELAGELRRRGRRYQLSGLVHLDDVDGLAARAAPGRVVARESQEDDEPEKDGEPRRQDAEHAGRPVAVGEEASLRRKPSQEEEEADRKPDRCNDDKDRMKDVQRVSRSHDDRANRDRGLRLSEPGLR
jgi:hypothetical protein